MSIQHAIKPDREWTWTDYRNWPDDERWEIIGGVACAMPRANSTAHQIVVGHLASRLERALAGKPSQAFVAPTDVKLTETDVVQPDVFVVRDPRKITPAYIEGAPDLVIEVLSPGTATRDLREKKALYARHGVREYVIVDPLERYALRFLLDGANYDSGAVFGGTEILPLVTLEGIEIALWEVFELPVPGSVPVVKGPGV